jgi:hypothetical protein
MAPQFDECVQSAKHLDKFDSRLRVHPVSQFTSECMGNTRLTESDIQSWADVDYALTHDSPLSIVVIGSSSSWTCHVLVHMFRVTYSKVLRIGELEDALNDNDGYVYHTVVLDDEIKVHDTRRNKTSGLLRSRVAQKKRRRICSLLFFGQGLEVRRDGWKMENYELKKRTTYNI